MFDPCTWCPANVTIEDNHVCSIHLVPAIITIEDILV